MTVELYTDGGLASPNPSNLAGSWAWVRVIDGGQSGEAFGWLRASEMPDGRITSNQCEFYAVLQALKATDDSRPVAVYMDSEVTYRRVAEMGARHGIPDAWYHEMGAELRRHTTTFHLLAAHPTRADLQRDPPSKANGMPVSVWNARADSLCKMGSAIARLVVLSELRNEDESQTILEAIEREHGRN